MARRHRFAVTLAVLAVGVFAVGMFVGPDPVAQADPATSYNGLALTPPMGSTIGRD